MEYREVAEDIYTDIGINGVYKWWIDLEASRSTNPAFIAMNYALLGENELALDWLAKTSNPFLKVNRVYNESLRSDPRFQAMLKKNRNLMGLED